MQDRDYTPRLSTFAKSMRSQPTDAERRLWQVLRAGNIEGFHFRRQHPIGGYILDFYCSDLRLAIEADGGQHYMPDGKQRDSRRDAALAGAGILMLRFSDYDILKHSDGVAETVYAKCVARAVELARPLRGARYRARQAAVTPSLTLPQGGDKREAQSFSSPLGEVGRGLASRTNDNTKGVQE